MWNTNWSCLASECGVCAACKVFREWRRSDMRGSVLWRFYRQVESVVTRSSRSELAISRILRFVISLIMQILRTEDSHRHVYNHSWKSHNSVLWPHYIGKSSACFCPKLVVCFSAGTTSSAAKLKKIKTATAHPAMTIFSFTFRVCPFAFL